MQDMTTRIAKPSDQGPGARLPDSDPAGSVPLGLLADLQLVPPGASFALFVRHAERPDFKVFLYRRNIHITARGRATAEKLGSRLASLDFNRVVSSPVLRCQQTSRAIMSGAGIGHLELQTRGDLGEPGSYIVDPLRVFLYFLREGVPAVIQRYAEQGRMAGFLPLRDESVRILREIVADLEGPGMRVLYLSHDAVLVPFITFFTGERFDPARWIDFLDGVVVAVKDGKVWLVRNGQVHAIDESLLAETVDDPSFFPVEE